MGYNCVMLIFEDVLL